MGFTAETLRQQYSPVFSLSRPEWTVNDVTDHFGSSVDDSLDDILFSIDDIEIACAELKGSVSAGPDGVPASLLKTVEAVNPNTVSLSLGLYSGWFGAW